MIKLIQLDLDGTLLADHVRISEKNRQAIAWAQQKGVYVGLNTGRTYLSASAFSCLAGLNAPVVCSNGAVIKDEERLYFQSALSEHLVRRAADACWQVGVPFHAFTHDGYYACGKSRQNDLIESWCQQAQEMIMRGVVYCDTLTELLQLAGGKIVKITISSLNRAEMEAVHNRLKGYTDWETAFSLGCMLEITNPDIHKGSGLTRLCQELHITCDQVLALGDDRNDLSMFSVAGHGVAMSNGDPVVLAAADLVVDNSSNDGVAKAIYQFVEG